MFFEELLAHTGARQRNQRPVSLTSVFPLRGNRLDGSENIWGKYVDTTIDSVTYLH